jgi:hypothetical protein
MRQVSESPHIELHLKWAEGLMLSHGSLLMTGTQFTCFTGTKVQMLALTRVTARSL